MARKRKWIQKAIKRPGALVRWLKRGGWRIIVGATRKPVWTETGEINTNTLKEFRNTEAYKKLDTRRKQQINTAITLERLSKRPKKRSKAKRKK